MNIEIVKDNLSRKGFRVRHFATAEQAREAALGQPQRMCGALVRLMRPVGGRTFHMWLIDEDLGY